MTLRQKWFFQVIPAIIVLCISINVMSQETKESTRCESESLLATAKGFLNDWLVKRDCKAAMKYVSVAPILGKCARSPDTVGKTKMSPEESRAAVEWILAKGIDLSTTGSSLAEIIKSLQITPTKERNIAQGEPFDLFALNHIYNDAAFICKFDDNPQFRSAFSNPDVWYLVFKAKTTDDRDLSWIFSLRKEKNRWCIFSLGPLDD